jgi:precorrin-6A/cobalt-precorrin-6A reductase
MKILILGGTTEASELLRLLAGQENLNVTLSLAGRTQTPVLPFSSPSPALRGMGRGGGCLVSNPQNNTTPLPNPPPQGGRGFSCRIGGFGGALGLAQYIRENNINALVCATHPFARKMPFNALEAAEIAGIPLIFILRPTWQARPSDKWIEVDSHAQALSSIHHPSSIFLTVGRLELAEYEAAQQHYYVVRSIDEVAEKTLKNAKYITSRPPFNVADEHALMTSEKIDFVITKNSGGKATEAKLVAARELGIPVILINRPARPLAHHVATAQEARDWIFACS